MRNCFTCNRFFRLFAFLVFTFLMPPSVLEAQCVAGETGGTVWRDFNNDGIKDALETQGLSGVTVKAYNSTGTLAGTTTTNASGQYTFGVLSAAPTAGAKYRIEFSGLPALYQPTFNGTNGRTDVQFISAASCVINLGVNNPADYCQSNPLLSTTCFVNGQASSNLDVLVSFAYNSSGNPGSYTLNHDALNSEVGSVWGLAYNRNTKKLFSSAFVKRHSALGSDDIGGIYAVANPGPSAGTPAPLVNLGSFSAQVGSLGATPATRGLGAPNATSLDADAFIKVGKVGLGDLELSDDGNTLYTVNLNTGRVITIDLTAYNASGTAIAAGNLGLLPDYTVSCTNGSRRPFALKYYQGSLYLGVVCDAATGTRGNLTANVLKYSSGSWTSVLTYPLDYTRGTCFAENGKSMSANFQSWDDTFVASEWQNGQIGGVASTTINWAQPMFSDIEFDIDGAMIMSFMDRGGHQMGFLNRSPNSADATLYYYIAAGEILRASFNGTSYTLESNGVVGGLTGCGATNSGPGGKEFYCGENFYNGGVAPNDTYHNETVVGGVGLLPGKGEVAVALFDPLSIIAGGVGWMSNTNGSDLRGLQLFTYNNYSTDTTFGKANGIGDIEFLCNTAPIQIGNYVWIDTDQDGVQDPSEAPLSSITVSLWKGGSQIASTTTDNSGEYYFSSKYILGAAWTGTGADTTLLPNTAYEIRIATNQTGITTPNYALTNANSTTNLGNDQNDSDASINGGYAVIALTTGAAGTTNHTLDFGFFSCPTITSTLTQTAPGCSTGLAPLNNGKINLTAVANANRYGISAGASYTGPAYASATAFVSTALPLALISTVPNTGGTYTIRLFNGSDNCFTDQTVTVAAVNCTCPASNYTLCTGESYTLTATAGLTNIQWQVDNGSGFTDISGATNTTYTVTTSGIYRYTAKDNNCDVVVCCPATFTVNPVATANAGTAQTVCAGGTVTLAGSVGGGATSGTWTAPSGTFSNATSLTSTYTPSITSGTVTLTLTTDDPTGPCPTANSTVVITVNPVVTPTFTAVSPICAGASLSALPTTSNNSITGTWSPALNNSTTTTYTFTPTAGQCANTTTLTITVNPVPSTPSVTSPKMNVCPATTVNLNTISAALTPSVVGGVFEWRVSNLSSSALVGTPTAVANGTYYLFEKSTSDCYSAATAVQVQIQTCCPAPVCIPVVVTRSN